MANELRLWAHYMAYIWRPQALKPLFVMDRMVGRTCAIATLDSKPLAVFRVPSFRSPGTRWLERMTLELERSVHAIMTTGPANVHAGAVSTEERYNLVGIEGGDADIDSFLASLSKHDVELMEVDQSVFTSQAAHNWSFAHYYATSVDARVPIAAQLASSDRIPAPAFSLYVKLKPIPKAQRTVRTSVDLFVCDEALMRISTLDVRLANATKNDLLQRQTFLAHGKLPFSAMLMRRPFEFSHRIIVPPSL